MLHFDPEILLDKVFLDYISFSVRPFFPKPLGEEEEDHGCVDQQFPL